MQNSKELIDKVKSYNKFLNPKPLDKHIILQLKHIQIKKEILATLMLFIQ